MNVFKQCFAASEKRAFLLYYAVPLLSSYLPSDHLLFLMMLTGGLFRLLKQSISRGELQEAHTYLKLFAAEAPVLYGKIFKVVLRPKKKLVFPLDFKTMLTKH